MRIKGSAENVLFTKNAKSTILHLEGREVVKVNACCCCIAERENEWIFNPLDLINKQDIIPVYEEEWGRGGHMASPSPANVAISLH